MPGPAEGVVKRKEPCSWQGTGTGPPDLHSDCLLARPNTPLPERVINSRGRVLPLEHAAHFVFARTRPLCDGVGLHVKRILKFVPSRLVHRDRVGQPTDVFTNDGLGLGLYLAATV